MKKLVSLLLACLMVLSIGMLPAFASTAETEINSNATLEDGLDVGDLTNASYPQFRSTIAVADTNGEFLDADGNSTDGQYGVKVVADTANAANKMFELNAGVSGPYYDHKLSLYDPNNGGALNAKKFSARVKLPATDNSGARTIVFAQIDGAPGRDSKEYADSNFGVILKNGGAYYYDSDAEVPGLVNFLDEDKTIEAGKWYTIEAYLDARDLKANRNLYMNASVYDEEAEAYIGKSGWQGYSNVSYRSDWTKATHGTTAITARGYDKGDVVTIDEFMAYKVENIDSYTITDAGAEEYDNKYVSATSAGGWYRRAGEVFNATYKYISSTSDNKVARYEMSFRIPTFGSSYNLIGFANNVTLQQNASSTTVGMASVSTTGAFSAVDVNKANATLTGAGVSNNTYQLTANTWYKLVVEVDYSNFAKPEAKTVLKDETDKVLAESAAYTVAQMALDSYGRNSIVWTCINTTNAVIHFDNTKIYVATDADALATAAPITSEDFEVYDGDVNADLYEAGDLYKDLLTLHGLYDKNPLYQGSSTGNNAVIAMEKLINEGIDFVNNMTLKPEDGELKGLKFTYNAAIPSESINNGNIKLYAGENAETELVANVDYSVELAADGKSFTVLFLNLEGETKYTLRLSPDVCDSGAGYPAVAGGEDIVFTTAYKAAAYTIVPSLVDDNGEAVSEITAGTTVYGQAVITNNADTDLGGLVIVAVYEGTQLVSAKLSETFNIAKGAPETVTTTEGITLAANQTAKVFVWNGLTMMKPLTGELTVSAQ